MYLILLTPGRSTVSLMVRLSLTVTRRPSAEKKIHVNTGSVIVPLVSLVDINQASVSNYYSLAHRMELEFSLNIPRIEREVTR